MSALAAIAIRPRSDVRSQRWPIDDLSRLSPPDLAVFRIQMDAADPLVDAVERDVVASAFENTAADIGEDDF